MDADDLRVFSQVVLELHNLDFLVDEPQADIILQGAKKLFQHHLPIWVHANNFDPLVKFNSYWFPKTIEITYVNRDLAAAASPALLIATALDGPCDSRVSEISLEGLASLTSPDENN